jgi:hypothetical protein
MHAVQDAEPQGQERVGDDVDIGPDVDLELLESHVTSRPDRETLVQKNIMKCTIRHLNAIF